MRTLLRAMLVAVPGTLLCATAVPDPLIAGISIYLCSVAWIARNPTRSLWMDLAFPCVIGVVLIVYVAKHHR